MNEKFDYPNRELHTIETNSFELEFSDVRLKEMKELINPLKEVVLKLKDKIKNNEYNLIIGDDASGRVPALILYKFIKDKYKKQNKDIKLIFMAGSRETEKLEDKKSRMQEFLQTQLTERTDVLVITELIHRGDSLVPLTDILKDLNQQYDIATVGILRKYRLPSLEKKLGTQIIFGGESHPKIDGSNTIAGVQKDYEDLFATKLDMSEKERKIFLDGRHDINVIVEKLNQYYDTLNLDNPPT